MSLIERSVEYLKQYIAENCDIDKSDVMAVDRWIDHHITNYCMKSFPLETANDLIEAMNYVNVHNNHYNIFQPVETLENIKHQFLREVIIEYDLM